VTEPDVSVRKNPRRSRYELELDGAVVGVADFHDVGAQRVFPHTEIVHRLRGRGYGALLVRGALDDARAEGRKVVPRCWYVAQFIDENPAYRELVA
jgi:predicted GNAT family acetyltransferase